MWLYETQLWVLVFFNFCWLDEQVKVQILLQLEVWSFIEEQRCQNYVGKKKNKSCKYHFWKLRPEICYNPRIPQAGSELWSWSGAGVSGGVSLTHFWFARVCSALFYLNIYFCECLLFISWNFIYTHIYACTHSILFNFLFKYLLNPCYFLFYFIRYNY